MIAVRRRADNGVCVLVSEKTAAHLPVCEINPTRSIHSTLKKYMTEIFGSDLPPHRRKFIIINLMKYLIIKVYEIFLLYYQLISCINMFCFFISAHGLLR